MSLTTYLMGGTLVAAGLIYGWQELRVRARDTQIEAASAMVKVAAKDKQTAIDASEANADAALLWKAAHDREVKARVKAQGEARKRSADLTKLQKEIASAPGQNDPVPDVIERVLDSMRPTVGPSGRPADGSDKDPSAGTNPAAGTTDVPAEAGPAP